MLDSKTIKAIEDFVSLKPRSIQEIANHLNKNWRTIDRYVQEIKDNFGTLDVRTFREGTRGALKIVFWASIEKASNSVFQEMLERDIISGKEITDFSAMNIYQHIDEKNKKAKIEKRELEDDTDLTDLIEGLRNTNNQLLSFSGNLSYINLPGVFEGIESLVKKGVPIKIVCRVDLSGKENIENLLALNHKYGKELIEIHHREQPLRALIYDGKMSSIKELGKPTGKKHELKEKTYIFYFIKDKDWIGWLSKIFWKMFSSSINANKRLDELNKIK